MTDPQFDPVKMPAKSGARIAARPADLSVAQPEKIAEFVAKELQKALTTTESFKEYREYFLKKPVRLVLVPEEGTAKMKADGSIALSRSFLIDAASKAGTDGVLSSAALYNVALKLIPWLAHEAEHLGFSSNVFQRTKAPMLLGTVEGEALAGLKEVQIWRELKKREGFSFTVLPRLDRFEKIYEYLDTAVKEKGIDGLLQFYSQTRMPPALRLSRGQMLEIMDGTLKISGITQDDRTNLSLSRPIFEDETKYQAFRTYLERRVKEAAAIR